MFTSGIREGSLESLWLPVQLVGISVGLAENVSDKYSGKYFVWH